jgi:two-component system, LytTR family, sensor kinase
MKKLIDIKRFKLFLWIGLAAFIFGILVDLAKVSHKLSQPQPFLQISLDNLWAVIYLTMVNNFLFEYTLPRMGWKRFGSSLLRVLVFIFLYSCGLYWWRSIGAGLNLYTAAIAITSLKHPVAEQMGYSVGSVFFFGIIRHIYLHIKLKQATQQLRIEKQQAELNYLKSQTNPHFLFNTLNNIYSLARDKSDLAPESILRLSKILRYMLYEAGGAYIAIEQDLKIIGDYIELEKLRYDDSLRINFNYDIEDMKQALPPLLLMPLVENAFKHGVSETRNQPFVDVHLSVNKRQLTFMVNNSTGELPGEGALKENIGLSNLRRQLELLYTDYNLSVRQQGSVFSATLKINLASHV